MVLVVKNIPASAEDTGSIPGSGQSPGGGNGNPLQYSCLENPTDGGAWWATVHGAAKNWTWLSNYSREGHHFKSFRRSPKRGEGLLVEERRGFLFQ